MQTFFGSVKKRSASIAAFATDTALFHAAKGDAQIAHEPAVHPDRSGVNLLGDAMRATQVLRPTLEARPYSLSFA
jgi:hypothetical protein